MFVFPNGIAPAALQLANDGRVVGRPIIPQDLRSAGARLAGHADDVFDRDRHAAERQIYIGAFGLLESVIEIDRQIGVDLRLDFRDAGLERLQDFAREKPRAGEEEPAARRCSAPADRTRSFHDFRDNEKTVGLAWRIAQRFVRGEPGVRFIFAEDIENRNRVRGGFHLRWYPVRAISRRTRGRAQAALEKVSSPPPSD